VLALNRHRRGDAHAIADHLRPLFEEVRLRRVRREGENVLVCCARPRSPGAALREPGDGLRPPSSLEAAATVDPR
jgi:hypothetical protein